MKKIQNAYIVVLLIIAAFTIVSQIIIQVFFKEQAQDAATINIAGRQRMLSQKIAKQAYALTDSKDVLVFEQTKKELKKTLNIWNKNHFFYSMTKHV